MRMFVVCLGMTGCSMVPVSALIRSPVDSKCQSYGLKGCPELVDGAIAYAEGDKPLALQKLDRARALNTPAQLKQFAVALRTVGEASPEAGKPLIEVAALLSGEATVRTDVLAPFVPAEAPKSSPATVSPEAARPVATNDVQRLNTQQLTLYALTARTDPMRIEENTVWSTAAGVECQVGQSPALCVAPKRGPMIVTDVVTSEECSQRVYLAAADSDTPAFGLQSLLPARSAGIHGGSFFVAGWQWLFVAIKRPAKPQPNDQDCFVTWGGFRPRLIPTPPKDPDVDSRR